MTAREKIALEHEVKLRLLLDLRHMIEPEIRMLQEILGRAK